MSNLPLQSAGLDNDDSINPTYPKLPSMTGRITSFELLKHHQHSETRTANEQACDEIHELQPRNSSKKKFVRFRPVDHLFYSNSSSRTNSEKSYSKNSKSISPHQLMQSNYYDQTRFDPDYPSVNHQSEPGQININVDDYKDYKKVKILSRLINTLQDKESNSSTRVSYIYSFVGEHNESIVIVCLRRPFALNIDALIGVWVCVYIHICDSRLYVTKTQNGDEQ